MAVLKEESRSRTLRIAIGLAVAFICVQMSACDRVFGDRIEVRFRSVDGLKSGDAVYMAGIKIGTTGAPFLREGRAIVPVYVRDVKVLAGRGAVFLLSRDPKDPERYCLRAFSVGSNSDRRRRTFDGVNNELELVLLVGARKAEQFMQELRRWVAGALE